MDILNRRHVSGQTRCSYHPDNIAVDKCERCNRPICLEGKRIFRRHHTRGTGSSRSSYSTRHVYCPPCNADAAANAASGPGAIIFSIFFTVILSIITIAFFSLAGPLGIFPLGMMIFFFYSMHKTSKEADEAKRDEQQFLNSLRKKPEGIKKTREYSRIKSYTRPDKPWSLSDVHCFNCGEKLDLKANFCMNCGDPTTDEKEFVESNQ